MKSHIGEHVVELVKKGKRMDGRAFDQFREITIEKNVAATADGSAKARLGDTLMMVGIKMEVGTPYPDGPDEGTLMVGAELLPLSNSKYESGPPGMDSIEVARLVDRGIREAHTIDVKKLCITSGEKCWVVSIDVIPLNADGNLVDAAAIAALAALKCTKFPLFKDGVLYPRERTNVSLSVENLPIPVTVNKIADKFLVDLTEDEEDAVDAKLTITTMEDGTICSLQKGGDISLTEDEIMQMIELATRKAKEIRAKIIGG
jgi:exosome complex component RRP42